MKDKYRLPPPRYQLSEIVSSSMDVGMVRIAMVAINDIYLPRLMGVRLPVVHFNQ